MQSGKNAMESVKESAANVAASAKSGMDKSKATLQEKAERMTTRGAVEKDMATQKKDERIAHAELEKQEARAHNAAAKTRNTAAGTATYSTTGATGHPTGAHQMSALPGHGTGQPAGQVVEGVAPAHPVSTATGTGHNPRAGGTGGQGYSTGGHYS